jgi:hypothetical protein
MTANSASALIGRGNRSELILGLYGEFGNKSFTFEQIKTVFPDFKRGGLFAFHNAKVFKLVDGGRRSHQRTKVKNKWTFTDEAVRAIERHLERQELKKLQG